MLDALRYDHLHSRGYHRITSPNIDRLANEGVAFLRAYSHGPRTVYAMPSLFTSLYPAFHTMMHYGDTYVPLPEACITIPEVLKPHGYRTACVVTNTYLRDKFGMTQGFDVADQFGALHFKLSICWMLHKLRLLKCPYYATHWKPKASEVTDRAIALLRRLEDAPLFLFAHYMDTHAPYLPPPAFANKFLDIDDAPRPEEIYRSTANLIKDGHSPDDRSIETLKSYYDACIYYTDHEIGRLLEELQRISKKRSSMVIVTSDHGDEFLEHGHLGHINIAHEELVHVPLICWHPNRYPAGMRVGSLVRHIDIMPTLRDMLGFSKPQEAMGRSLEPLIFGEDIDFDCESYAQGVFNVSINFRNWKAIYVDTTSTYALYDLTQDPGETRNLWAEEPEHMSILRDLLDEYMEAATDIADQKQRKLDPEIMKRLKALGYL
ncbi:MAG: sulfatase-like hydrolase/transferase [Candidatus Latescibacteria bacterium]|nr:sulfatase-like hydrolase/transferase [Candidatus Latescibacterota bacterium]NIM64445.1 sulfatase-like hydrolase/transferase [Candidatus Latescibacterota bacterium]NIO00599.1 sulfatase-like hydrolase/transferase [Candidatus Latescibacterota bacterium]NIO26999.1 sulfatase-like hydrolase/transferase [Candidatus Latescibacterota bacterium]NIO56076.1 sulfatase-like hydrolase/transferase [Candidatus Latescibacterota bacterium]